MLAPYDAEDARGLLKAAIRDPDPVVFLENEILYGESFPVDDKILDKEFTVPIGKVKVSHLAHTSCHMLHQTNHMPLHDMQRLLVERTCSIPHPMSHKSFTAQSTPIDCYRAGA